MSIIGTAEEVFERRGGRLEIGSGGSFNRSFKVSTDDAVADGPYEVCFAAGVPRLGDPFPSDPLYACRSVTPEMNGSPSLLWTVTCEYSRSANDRDEDQDNPMNAPVEIEIGGNKWTGAPRTDLDGGAFVNSAGEGFETPVEVTFTNPTATFIRNEPIFTFQTHSLPYDDHINSGSFLGGAAGTVRCADISATRRFSKQQEYWQVKYVFEYNKFGWQPQVLDIGYNELYFNPDTSQLEPLRLTDANGRDLTSPSLLDGSGGSISPPRDMTQAVFIEFRVYETADFNLLGLPT